jgi:hypothetical protein
MTYDEKLQAMRDFGAGEVKERDFFDVVGREPYRHATLTVQVPFEVTIESPFDDAISMGQRLIELNRRIRGYLTMNTYEGIEAFEQICTFQLHVSRDLSEHEMEC